MNDIIMPEGTIDLVIKWDDGRIEHRQMRNRILRSGRILMAQALANQFGAAFQFFVTGISFGSGGTTGVAPRYIDDTRTGLFGPTITTKSVISSIDPTTPTKATFTSVLTFDEAGLLQAAAKSVHVWRRGGRSRMEEPHHRHCRFFGRLLRARGARPRSGSRRAAEQRDECAPPHHSITSSAMASSVGGTVRPSALAVLRLITNSNLVGCITGISAGLAPFRIWPQ